MIAAAVAAAASFAPAAMADFEYVVDMSGVAVEDGQFVYGNVVDEVDYAGRSILGIGIRDLEVTFVERAEITFSWAMDLSALGPQYGVGIFTFVGDGPIDAFSTETYNYSADVSQYGGVVASGGAFGDWNMGTFVGSAGVNDALNVISGEMYYILEGEPVPAPGALALLGLAGFAARRRRS